MGNQTELNDTTVPSLVRVHFGITVLPRHGRFNEPEWTFQGTSDLFCTDCDSALVVYRKPYSTSTGNYRYWAIVCLGCREICSLDDYEAATKKDFRIWDKETPDGLPPQATDVTTEAEFARPDRHGESEDQLTDDQSDRFPSVATEPPRSSDGDQVEASSVVEQMESGAPPANPAVTGPQVSPLAIQAARAEVAASAGHTRVVDIGRAEKVEGQGLFCVTAPAVDLTEQPPGETYLAMAQTDATRVPCRVRHASPTEAVVEAVDDQAVPNGAHLFVQIDPSAVSRAFAEYLEKLQTPGLARVLTGELALQVAPLLPVIGLNPEQQLAAGHLVGAGATVIWGPPGTGKTRVIGAAVSHLLRAGKSVCLVSNTNVAVDQALLHVARGSEPFEPGEILRIGNPTIPDIGNHQHLTLRKAVEAKFATDLRELDRLQAELSARRDALEAASSGAVARLLASTDKESLELLVARRIRIRRKLQAERELAELELGIVDLYQRVIDAARAFDDARASVASFGAADTLLDDERLAASQRLSLKRLDTRCAELKSSISAYGTSMKDRRKRRVVEGELQRCADEHSLILRDLGIVESRLAKAARNGETPAALRAALQLEQDADVGWRRAKHDAEAVDHTLAELRVEIADLSEDAGLDDADNSALAIVDQYGSVDRLLREGRNVGRRIGQLEKEVRGLAAQIQVIQARLQNADAALVEEAKVIGTTLAQLVLHRGLRSRSFDHVIVDEASAALAHTVYAALSKADHGCALVGDFEQNGPISRCAEGKLSPELRPWLLETPFTHVGISNAEVASSTPGCVVLRRQYRFGQRVMALANSIAYGGVLVAGRDATNNDPSEITFIDTSQIRADGLVQRGPTGTGRWWGLGAAISCSLARMHGFDGVGVVSPYKHQVQLIRARLLDHGGVGVQVGTVHSFQGREFPFVIVDLVEDGTGTSWVARAKRRGSAWERDGVRLFTVAVTRTAGRLYLVGNLGAVRTARTGPFAELRQMLDRSELDVVDARSVLGSPVEDDRHAIWPMSRGLDIAEAELLDDDEFYRQFLLDLSAARTRCVIFSPFVGARRVADLRAHLDAACARGVKVHVFTKTASELGDSRALDTLSSAGVILRERLDMHEKVVLIDDDVAYIGSLNVLSNNGRTGEVMLRMPGSETNVRLTQWMRAAAKRG